MGFDPLVSNAGRLAILTTLAREGSPAAEFVAVRRETRLTDGNLSAHARRLQGAGLIEIHKQFRDGKPVTTMKLTAAGREALEAHARALMEAVGVGPRTVFASTESSRSGAPVLPDGGDEDETWVD